MNNDVQSLILEGQDVAKKLKRLQTDEFFGDFDYEFFDEWRTKVETALREVDNVLAKEIRDGLIYLNSINTMKKLDEILSKLEKLSKVL